MLIKPNLLNIIGFDASKDQTVYFEVQAGGTQVVANQLTIRDQANNEIIYQNIQNVFKYEHVVPADTLVNGGYYNATVITIDAQGNQSLPSATVQFRCFSEPKLFFTNIPDGNVIISPSYSFAFRYTQEEGESLDSYVVNLYNSSKVLISTSGTLYTKIAGTPYDGTYLFTGFEDKQIYYVEIIGETVEGIIVKTEQTRIQIRYSKPSLFTLLELTNNCEGGYITVASNIIVIEGTSNPIPPIFIDNKEVDLRKDGDFVEWDKGYSISDDFLVRGWFRNPNPMTTLICFSNVQGQSIKIDYMEGYESVDSTNKQAYMQATIKSLDGYEYYIFSNYINILSSTEYYNLQFKRENNLYQISINSIEQRS